MYFAVNALVTLPIALTLARVVCSNAFPALALPGLNAALALTTSSTSASTAETLRPSPTKNRLI